MSIPALSLRAYAAHRKRKGLPGGSLQAVQRAIAAERISYVLADGAKKIADPEAADREWAANTDRTRAGDYIHDQAEGEEGLELGPEGEIPAPMRTAAAREKFWKAERAELETRKLAGELVDAGDVEKEWAEFCTTVRTRILGVPAKMKQRRPHLTHEDLAELDTQLREALEALSRIDPQES